MLWFASPQCRGSPGAQCRTALPMVDHTLKDKAREIFECIQKQYRVIGVF